jgi:hypothetical protein
MIPFTLGKLKGINYTQLRDYKEAVATYNIVEAFNSNVSTLRGNGNKSIEYYEFKTYDEKESYLTGLYFLTENNPSLKITPVKKN